MNQSKRIREVILKIEQAAEEALLQYPGYPRVKEVLDGKRKGVDARALIMDSKAFFAGKRSPLELVREVLNASDSGVKDVSDDIQETIGKKENNLGDRLEKERAKIENRPIFREYQVKKDNAVLAGRLTSDDGEKPMAGVLILVRGQEDADGRAVIAKTRTDMNGEYVIRLDKDKLNKAGKSLSIDFETRSGEPISKSRNYTPGKIKGKATIIQSTVDPDKMVLAARFVGNIETNRRHAGLEMAELKKNGAEIRMLKARTEITVNELKDRITKIKEMFEVE